MSSTLLNEDLILTLLGTAPSAEHGENLRTAAFLVLLDSYDRRVTRESFFDTAKNAMQLNEMMGRLESVTGVLSTFKANALSGEKMEAALETITGHVETCRKSLLHDMSLLIQCPNDGDTKH
jgi:hypothetical protein